MVSRLFWLNSLSFAQVLAFASGLALAAAFPSVAAASEVAASATQNGQNAANPANTARAASTATTGASSPGATGTSSTGTATVRSAAASGAAAVSAQETSPPLRPGLLSSPGKQGLLTQAQNQEHQHGIITRALGSALSEAGHATMALVGTTILNQGIDLPPDDASSPEWPFSEPHRKAMFVVDWADGSTAKISRLPDGSLQILGGGRRYTMQPEGEGSFALLGDYGSMASVTPRPGGGYTIIKADGRVEQVVPREGGGFVVTGSNGLIATILPGVGGRKHVIHHRPLSSSFVQ